MSKKPPKSVRLGFERDCMEIALDLLHVEIPPPTGIKETVKYKQVCTSVQAIGLVEPIVVAHSRQSVGSFIVLDGRMRLEALRDRGAQKALCLISTDDEGYTYNKRVNRLSVVQEHRMIVRAAERGVSVQQLADVLDVTPGAIRQQFKLLDGICSEAVALLADKPATYAVFRALKQMKPFRQIDVAQAMINLGNYSAKLALAMLQATSPDQLTEEASAKAQRAGRRRRYSAWSGSWRRCRRTPGCWKKATARPTCSWRSSRHTSARRFWKTPPSSDGWRRPIPSTSSNCSSSPKSNSCHHSSQVRASPAMPGRAVRAAHRAACGVSTLRLPSLMPPRLCRCALRLPVNAGARCGDGWLAVPFILAHRSRGQGLRALVRLRPGGRR